MSSQGHAIFGAVVAKALNNPGVMAVILAVSFPLLCMKPLKPKPFTYAPAKKPATPLFVMAPINWCLEAAGISILIPAKVTNTVALYR